MADTLLITNVGELTTQDAEARVLRDAAVLVREGRIEWIGAAHEAGAELERRGASAASSAQSAVSTEVVDAQGRALLPGWVDSHTHLIFSGDRSAEFEARMAGESYSAGGIGVTTTATREASDAELAGLLRARIAEAVSGGTTYLETKTGYGLDVDEEARHARIAAEAVEDGLLDAVTFLGAHLVPAGSDAEAYTDLVVGPMLEAVRPWAQWADVFCERGAFTAEESDRVLRACGAAGLGLRVHGNQLGPGEGVRLAVEHDAASVDHVNYLDEIDVQALAGTWSQWDRASSTGTPGTVATCLPACDLSTRQPLAPGRELLDAGVEIALASNCNPGTSYTSSMSFCVGTAVLQMGLSLHEALRAATYGGALALRAQDEVGSIEVGKRADLHLLDAPAAIHLAYRPGMPLTHTVWRRGVRQ